VDCSGGELEGVGGSDGGPVFQGIVVAPQQRRWGAEVEWCAVIRDLEHPGWVEMVVLEVERPESVWVWNRKWWAVRMGHRWEEYLGWVHEHCGSWRFFGRGDETDTGCVLVRWVVKCGSYSGEVVWAEW
jgi:hypothetical protein